MATTFNWDEDVGAPLPPSATAEQIATRAQEPELAPTGTQEPTESSGGESTTPTAPTPEPTPTPTSTPTSSTTTQSVDQREQELRQAVDYSEKVKSGVAQLQEGQNEDAYWQSVEDVKAKLAMLERAKEVEDSYKQAGVELTPEAEEYIKLAKAIAASPASPFVTISPEGQLQLTGKLTTAEKAGVPLSEFEKLGFSAETLQNIKEQEQLAQSPSMSILGELDPYKTDTGGLDVFRAIRDGKIETIKKAVDLGLFPHTTQFDVVDWQLEAAKGDRVTLPDGNSMAKSDFDSLPKVLRNAAESGGLNEFGRALKDYQEVMHTASSAFPAEGELSMISKEMGDLANSKEFQDKFVEYLQPSSITDEEYAKLKPYISPSGVNVQQFVIDNPSPDSIKILNALRFDSKVVDVASKYVDSIQEMTAKADSMTPGKLQGINTLALERAMVATNVRPEFSHGDIVAWNSLSDEDKQKVAGYYVNDKFKNNPFADTVASLEVVKSTFPAPVQYGIIAGELALSWVAPPIGMPLMAAEAVIPTIAKASVGEKVGAMEIATDTAMTALAVLTHTSPAIVRALPGVAGKVTVGAIEGGAIATMGTNIGLNWKQMPTADKIINIGMMVALPVTKGLKWGVDTIKAQVDTLTTKGGILPTALKTGGQDLAYVEVPDIFKGVEGQVADIIRTKPLDQQSIAIRGLLNPESQIKFDAYMKQADVIRDLKLPDTLTNKTVDFSNVKVIEGKTDVADGIKDWLRDNADDVYVYGSTARVQQLKGISDIKSPNDFDFLIREGSKLTPEEAVQGLADYVRRSASSADVKVEGTKLIIDGVDVADVHIEGYAGKSPFGWPTISKPKIIDGVAFGDTKQLLYDLMKPPTTPGVGESAGLLFPSAKEPFPRGKVGEYTFGTIPARTKDIMAFNVAMNGIADTIAKTNPELAKSIRDNLYTIQTTPSGHPLLEAATDAEAKTRFLDLVSSVQKDVLDKGIDATAIDPVSGGTLIRIASPASKVTRGVLYTATRDITPFADAAKQGYFEVGKLLGVKSGELTVPTDVEFTRKVYTTELGNIKGQELVDKIAEIYGLESKPVEGFNLLERFVVMRDVLGMYDPKTGEIALNNMKDSGVILHELTHPEIAKNITSGTLRELESIAGLPRESIDAKLTGFTALKSSPEAQQIANAFDELATIEYSKRVSAFDAPGYRQSILDGLDALGEKIKIKDLRTKIDNLAQQYVDSLNPKFKETIVLPEMEGSISGGRIGLDANGEPIVNENGYVNVKSPSGKDLWITKSNADVIARTVASGTDAGKYITFTMETKDAPRSQLFTSPDAAFDFLLEREAGVLPEKAGIIAIRTTASDIAKPDVVGGPFRYERDAQGNVIVYDERILSGGTKAYSTRPTDLSLSGKGFTDGATGETLTYYPRTKTPVPMLWFATDSAKVLDLGAPTLTEVRAMNWLAFKGMIGDLLHPHITKDVSFAWGDTKGVKGSLLNFYRDTYKWKGKSETEIRDAVNHETDALAKEAIDNLRASGKLEKVSPEDAQGLIDDEVGRIIDDRVTNVLNNSKVMGELSKQSGESIVGSYAFDVKSLLDGLGKVAFGQAPSVSPTPVTRLGIVTGEKGNSVLTLDGKPITKDGIAAVLSTVSPTQLSAIKTEYSKLAGDAIVSGTPLTDATGSSITETDIDTLLLAESTETVSRPSFPTEPIFTTEVVPAEEIVTETKSMETGLTIPTPTTPTESIMATGTIPIETIVPTTVTPEPIIPTVTTPPTTKPPPPVLKGETDKDKVAKIQKGTITWIQGRPQGSGGQENVAMWKILPPPYRQEDFFTMRETPPGAVDDGWSGKGMTKKSLQIIGGLPENNIENIDLGWARININVAGGKPEIEYVHDEDSNTGQRSETVGMGKGQIPVGAWDEAKAQGIPYEEFIRTYNGELVGTKQGESPIKPVAETSVVLPKASESSVPETKNYEQLYENLVALAGKSGIKVKTVSYDTLKDYAAMNPDAAKTMGYDVPEDEIWLNERWNTDAQDKFENLQHELNEMGVMEAGASYKQAHEESLAEESDTTLKNLTMPASRNGETILGNVGEKSQEPILTEIVDQKPLVRQEEPNLPEIVKQKPKTTEEQPARSESSETINRLIGLDELMNDEPYEEETSPQDEGTQEGISEEVPATVVQSYIRRKKPKNMKDWWESPSYEEPKPKHIDKTGLPERTYYGHTLLPPDLGGSL